jgi:beta-N-acetylhexosaminidase
MSTADLTTAPYELDDEAIAWAQTTIESLDVDEKVGQLFINLNNRFDDEFVNRIVDGYHPGGMRYNHTDSTSIQARIRQAQARSTVPLLVASNIEAGGNGAAGLKSIMVGHIMLPEYSRKLRPGIPDADILPATVAPELLTDLLRDDLGFNGVILTDASLMVGLTSALPRERQLVQAVTAGCDMILFFRNHDEDFGFVRAAVDSGEITADRLNDALMRILGLKAKLGLHRRAADDLVPPVAELEVIGSAEHHQIAAHIADQTIALLKDTAGTLPLDPVRHRRIRLYCLESAPDFTGVVPEFKRVAIEELTAAGFAVSVFRTAQELAADGQGLDMQSFLASETHEYTEKYDAALILANVSDFAQQGALRIRWSMPMGPEMPWYAAEVPTVFVSLNLPNHLIDVPMVKTAINAHNPTVETVRALVAKLVGRSEFTGTHNDNVWCGSWDTRR